MNKKPHKNQHRNKSEKQPSIRADETLRGEIRQLKAVIRNLQKRLKYFERRTHFAEDNTFVLIDKELEAEYKSEVKQSEANCPTCGKGSLSLLNLGRASYLVCSLCSHREKTNHEGG